MGLGWSCKLCLLSGPVGSGTLLWLFCHLSCTPRAFGMLRPPWAELRWLVAAVMLWSWVSLPVRGELSSAFAAFGLVSHSSRDLIVARNCPGVFVFWV